jgi:hypothetical protein
MSVVHFCGVNREGKHVPNYCCEIEKLEERLKEAEDILMRLSDRHEWSPHGGKCICESHNRSREYLEKYKEKKQ